MDEEKRPGLGNLKGRVKNAQRFPCTKPCNVNMNHYPELVDFLPNGYQYHVCKYMAVNQTCGGDHISFEATVRLTLQSKEEFLLWLKSMPVTWRVAHTRPTTGQKTIFKADYRCQHNTRTRPDQVQDHTARRSKNTGCPAKLEVSLVRTVNSLGQQSRSTDPHIPSYPMTVDIRNIHNHNIHVADAVRHRDVGSVAVEKLTKLFEAGHSPSSALDVLKYDLQVEYGDDYIYISADRSICPDLQFCYDEQPLPSTATEDLDHPDETGTEELRSLLKEFSDTVLNNEALVDGASAMLKTFRKLKGNPSMLLSAMHMFGRCGTKSTSQRARALRRVANRAGPSIAAQPTSVACRKMKLGGRCQLTSGRPKKSVTTMDYRYSYPKGERSISHSFSDTVERGRSNPK